MRKFKVGDLVIIKKPSFNEIGLDDSGNIGIVCLLSDRLYFPPLDINKNGRFRTIKDYFITVDYDEGEDGCHSYLAQDLEYLDHIDPKDWNDSAAYGQSTIYLGEENVP
jgi:hypothetical protein